MLMRVTVASDRDDIEEVEAFVKSVASAAGAEYRMFENLETCETTTSAERRANSGFFVEQLAQSSARGFLLGENWDSCKPQ